MSRNDVWVGIHDNVDTIPRWLDPSVSYTWLRTFEQADDRITRLAYLRERHYDLDLPAPVREVSYRFRTGSLDTWIDDVIAQDPGLVFFNCCWYLEDAPAVQRLRDALPDAVLVVRIHHEVDYLAAGKGFREFVNVCDVAIAPTQAQEQDLRDLGFTGTLHHLPFGIDPRLLAKNARPWEERDLQLASAANAHPGRNLGLIESVFAQLRARGYRVENFNGLPHDVLVERMGRTKTFLLSAMTEASGSRVLPEAMAAGCLPVTFSENLTATDLIDAHQTGASIATGIVYDYARKIATLPPGITEDLTEALAQLIDGVEQLDDYAAPPLAPEYDEEYEIAELGRILADAAAASSDFVAPRRRSALPLPTEDAEHAFNPTVLATPRGTLCVYRHVGGDGRRALRRTFLDAFLDAGEAGAGGLGWSDLSAELMAAGCPTTWHADPRLFAVGERRFFTFNTGHSESPNQIYLVEIDPDGRPLRRPWVLEKHDGRHPIEKNWGMFGHGADLYAIYSIAPFVVLRIELGAEVASARVVATHPWDASAYQDAYGPLHGGASPVRVGDELVLVAQSNVRRAGRWLYRGAVLTFAAEPPFTPRRYTPTPILRLAADEALAMPQRQLNPGVTECLYPTGATYHPARDTLDVTYGVNDFRAGIRSYDWSRIAAHLQPVTGAIPAQEREKTW